MDVLLEPAAGNESCEFDEPGDGNKVTFNTIVQCHRSTCCRKFFLSINFQPRSLRWPTWRGYGCCTFGSFFLGTRLHLINNRLRIDASPIKVTLERQQMLRVMFTQRIRSTATRTNSQKSSNVLPCFVLCHLWMRNSKTSILQFYSKIFLSFKFFFFISIKKTNCEKM